MPEPDRAQLVDFIAASPEAGDVIAGTNGVRKLRWALAGSGKRGGARVIYYFHSWAFPVFLLAAYGKNEKANLTNAERNAISKLVPALVAGYAANRGRRL